MVRSKISSKLDENEFKINARLRPKVLRNQYLMNFKQKKEKGTFCLKIHLGCVSKISAPKGNEVPELDKERK